MSRPLLSLPATVLSKPQLTVKHYALGECSKEEGQYFQTMAAMLTDWCHFKNTNIYIESDAKTFLPLFSHLFFSAFLQRVYKLNFSPFLHRRRVRTASLRPSLSWVDTSLPLLSSLLLHSYGEGQGPSTSLWRFPNLLREALLQIDWRSEAVAVHFGLPTPRHS